jgi:hypothetical protein
MAACIPRACVCTCARNVDKVRDLRDAHTYMLARYTLFVLTDIPHYFVGDGKRYACRTSQRFSPLYRKDAVHFRK